MLPQTLRGVDVAIVHAGVRSAFAGSTRSSTIASIVPFSPSAGEPTSLRMPPLSGLACAMLLIGGFLVAGAIEGQGNRSSPAGPGPDFRRFFFVLAPGEKSEWRGVIELDAEQRSACLQLSADFGEVHMRQLDGGVCNRAKARQMIDLTPRLNRS